MTIEKKYLYSFIISGAFLLLGFFLSFFNFKIFPLILLLVGLLFTLFFILIGTYHLNNQKNVSQLEIVVWLLGFLFLPHLTGFIYYAIKFKNNK